MNLKNELRVPREPGRENGGQRQSFVEGIRVQRLRPAENGGHGLHARTDDVVVRVLFGQGPTCRKKVPIIDLSFNTQLLLRT